MNVCIKYNCKALCTTHQRYNQVTMNTAPYIRRRARLAQQVGKGVARCTHHRKRSPQVVENARSEAEGRLEVFEVGAHSNVGVEQIVGALSVGNPPLVEEDGLSE